jgi:RHS repeat-associated protein
MDRLSDDKTGLIYANARYLDPDTGRFLSFDPFEGYDNKPISLHRYLYAYQNPARYVDKDGRCAEPITATLCVGAVIGTAFFLSETVAYLSSDPDGNGQSVASEIGTATSQLMDNVKTATVDYYARQAVALLSAGVTEGEVSPNTTLVHDVPQRGRDDHPADTDLNRPRIDTTPIVESLPGRMETPYHDKSPEEYILSTPSRAGDIDSGLMLVTKSAEARAKEIHSVLDPRAQRARTTAVTETQEGVRVVSSSERRLTPAQRAQLGANEVEGVGAGHAEVTGVNAARNMGLTPTGTAASRPICSSCAGTLSEQGIDPLSPLK